MTTDPDKDKIKRVGNFEICVNDPDDVPRRVSPANEERVEPDMATDIEKTLEQHARARRSNALEAGQLLAREALDALEDSSWDKAAAFSAAATAQFVFAMTPVLENDFDFEV